MDVSKNFVQAIPCISTHTCICFQKNELIFNPKNQWEQITCEMCEIFWWELSWTSPDFFEFSVLSTDIPVTPGHTWVLRKSKSFKSCSRLHWLLQGIEKRGQLIFSSLPENSKCVRRGQPCFWRYQYHMVLQGTTKFNLELPPNHGSIGKEDYFVLSE